jgi:NADH dehydrogenase
MDATAPKKRILILGGGFGGVYTASHLERLNRRRPDVEIVLVSQDNFLLMTPLLFEVFSGSLDLRSCCFPVRAFLRSTRFAEAAVQAIDLDRRAVRLALGGKHSELGKTDREMIPGSEHAFTFRTLADALRLRTHVIERFERADAESDPRRKAQLLTFVVIGGGLVGVELLGELTAFVDGIIPLYEHVDRDEIRFLLLHRGDRIMPEMDPKLAEYGARVLGKRPGVDLRTRSRVRALGPGRVHLADETIAADTIVLAAGTCPDPAVAGLPVEKDRRGRIVVEATMRCRGRPEVWALGDCASIPGPDGKPYPNLAQHALREARTLAGNIHRALNGRPPRPFVYYTLGMMGSLGHCRGFGQLLGVRVRGFPAWFIRRTYYLLQMPGWGRKMRILIDWTFALLMRPDVVKVRLDGETTRRPREAAPGDAAAGQQEEAVPTETAADRGALAHAAVP